MAYEKKPGSGTLFKNDRKQSNNHPDYKGDALLMDGTEVWLSGWKKEGNKGTFLSISIKPKEAKAYKPAQLQTATDLSDEIPF